MKKHVICLLILFFFCIASVSHSDPNNTKLKQRYPLPEQTEDKANTQELKRKYPLPVNAKHRANTQEIKQKDPLPVQDVYKKKLRGKNTPIQRKIDSTSSPNTKLREIEHAGSKGEQVVDKLGSRKDLGRIFDFNPKDDSQIRPGVTPGIGFGENLLEGKEKDAGLRHPGLIEERDLLTTPNQVDKESERRSIGESFGLNTDNPRNKDFNDAMSSFGTAGAGDSRLMADDKKDGDDGPTSGDVITSGEQEDGKINAPYEDNDGEIHNYTATPVAPKSFTDQAIDTVKGLSGKAWKGVVNTVGSDGGDDDDGTTNVAVGVRSTPVPDEVGSSRTELTQAEKARILQEQGAKIGLGGDADEPGGTRSEDPSKLKESAVKLTEGLNPIAPYARPTDDDGSTSEDFSGFGSEQSPQQDPGTLVDPIEPELVGGTTENPNQPGGGEIPRR